MNLLLSPKHDCFFFVVVVVVVVVLCVRACMCVCALGVEPRVTFITELHLQSFCHFIWDRVSLNF